MTPSSATPATPAELIGRNPRILNNGATPRATYEDLWATLLRGEVWRGEFHNTRKDGTPSSSWPPWRRFAMPTAW